MKELPPCYRCRQPVTPWGECGCKDGVCLIHSDCRDVLPLLESGSVDLVLTDPPYPKEFDHVWDALPLCYQSMRDGAYLVTFLGHYQLPRVLDACRRTLDYVWCVTLPNNNQPIMHGYKVKCCWKPCLVFSKGKPKANRIWYDNFGLRTKTKAWQESQSLHKWGQSESLLWEPLDAFGNEGGVTLDPFAGSGTTGRACKDLGRKCIMVEIEERYCEIAANRLRQEVLF